jgi:hypothetical protein
MAKALNSYIKYLISERKPVVKLIHQHDGLEPDSLTDDAISTALHQAFNQLAKRKSAFIDPHQQALATATGAIPYVKSLNILAKDTLRREIEKLPLLRAE